MSAAYLRDEFEKVEMCEELDEIGCSISMPNQFDPFKWNAVFIGPKNSPYHGGFFKMEIIFPNNYPESKPSIHFTTKIYHPNIKYDDGDVCIASLKNWDKNRTMIQLLLSVYVLLIKPNPNDPYNTEAANLYKSNEQEFWKTANQYVRSYALI